MNKVFVRTLSVSLVILLFSCFSLSSFAQEPIPADIDTTAEGEILQPVQISGGEPISEMPVEMADSTKVLPIPGIAAFYSAALPGLGQAYNNSHWKIPIIYVGATFIAGSIITQHKQYTASRQNLQTLVLNPDIPSIRGRDIAQWDRRVIFYRRQRDYFIILGGVLYMLNIVEAYTDAHLQDFNVNDDLALRIKPSLMATPGGSPAAGIALTLNIR